MDSADINRTANMQAERILKDAYTENEIRSVLESWKQFHPRTFNKMIAQLVRIAMDTK